MTERTLEDKAAKHRRERERERIAKRETREARMRANRANRRPYAMTAEDRTILAILKAYGAADATSIRDLMNRSLIVGKSLWAVKARLRKLARRALVEVRDQGIVRFYAITDKGRKVGER